MTPVQVLRQVEVPNALPLLLSGVRSATLQVVATATIAAYVGLGGLGRYLIDGIALGDYPQTAGGAGARGRCSRWSSTGSSPSCSGGPSRPGSPAGGAVSVAGGRIHAASRLRPTGPRPMSARPPDRHPVRPGPTAPRQPNSAHPPKGPPHEAHVLSHRPRGRLDPRADGLRRRQRPPRVRHRVGVRLGDRGVRSADRRRRRQLLGVDPPRRDLRRRAERQGHRRLDQAQHRLARDLPAGPRGQLGAGLPRVHRRPGVQLRQGLHGHRPRGGLRPRPGGPPGHPGRARQVRRRGQRLDGRHQGDGRREEPQDRRRPRRRRR